MVDELQLGNCVITVTIDALLVLIFYLRKSVERINSFVRGKEQPCATMQLAFQS